MALKEIIVNKEEAKGILINPLEIPQFSGTEECYKCEGKVVYSVKRSDGADLGECQKCGKIYLDPKGNRVKPPKLIFY